MAVPLSVPLTLSMVGSPLQAIPISPMVLEVVLLALVMITVILLFMQCMRALRTWALQGSYLRKDRLVSAKWPDGMLLGAQMVIMFGMVSVWVALTPAIKVRVRLSWMSPIIRVPLGVRLLAQMGCFVRRSVVLPPIIGCERASLWLLVAMFPSVVPIRVLARAVVLECVETPLLGPPRWVRKWWTVCTRSVQLE